jgi:hypothetical protein
MPQGEVKPPKKQLVALEATSSDMNEYGPDYVAALDSHVWQAVLKVSETGVPPYIPCFSHFEPELYQYYEYVLHPGDGRYYATLD